MSTAVEATLERLTADVLGGARVVLQRFPRGASSAEIAQQLQSRTGRATVSLADLQEIYRLQDGNIAVLDARPLDAANIANLEGVRREGIPVGVGLIVVLDARTGVLALQNAPHLCSWAGGVWLPERAVRYARAEDEVETGRRLLSAALKEEPSLAMRVSGVSIGIDLHTKRVFEPTLSEDALTRARWELDEGILFVERQP